MVGNRVNELTHTGDRQQDRTRTTAPVDDPPLLLARNANVGGQPERLQPL